MPNTKIEMADGSLKNIQDIRVGDYVLSFDDDTNELVSKKVQIKYKGETKNKQGGLSVQFPIFQIVRDEKTTPSYN